MSARSRRLGARLPPLPALAVFASATAVMTWRVLSWRPSQSTDAWAYLAWGRALLRGERPLYDHALTTPKPLGMLLGALAAPVPPDHGFQMAVVVLLGAMAAALYWVAFQQAGSPGAVVVLACLGLSAVIGQSLRAGLIDGVAAALVALAIATRGGWRLACLILAGLIRPEAWLLAGVAAYAQATGGVRRRLGFAMLGAALAPAIWGAVDLVLTGDMLASSDRAYAVVAIMGATPPALSSMPKSLAIAITGNIGTVAVVAGLAGVVILTIRDHRRRSLDPLLAAVLIGWPAVTLIETRSVPFEARYLFAMMVPLLVGCAVAVGAALRGRRFGGAWVAACCASIAFALALLAAPMPHVDAAAIARQQPAARRAIERALTCGPLEMLVRAGGQQRGRRSATRMIPRLAVITDHSLHDFVIGSRVGRVSGVLSTGSGDLPAIPGWVVSQTAFGTLAVTPACAA